VQRHHILLGKPFHHHVVVLGHRLPSLCVSIESSFFSITKKRPKPKKLFTCPTNFPVSNLFCINNVFSYSPFSIAIVKYPALINFTDFLNLEVPQQIKICSCCCCPLILFQKLREFDEKIIKKIGRRII